jgi:hypothetical protein
MAPQGPSQIFESTAPASPQQTSLSDMTQAPDRTGVTDHRWTHFRPQRQAREGQLDGSPGAARASLSAPACLLQGCRTRPPSEAAREQSSRGPGQIKHANLMRLNDGGGLKQYTVCIFRALHAAFRIHRLHAARADVLRGPSTGLDHDRRAGRAPCPVEPSDEGGQRPGAAGPARNHTRPPRPTSAWSSVSTLAPTSAP